MSASPLTDGSRITVSSNQISCDLAGEIAILNLDNGVYYGLDPVGARLWTLLQEPQTFAQVRGALLLEFDVDADVLESDLRELLGDLIKQGLIDIQP
ncbi:MAG TPA: PqqD family protein [Vicinamibacterales bacterium]|nr:PqqD family protein [Vicinamibacterales bacterium]